MNFNFIPLCTTHKNIFLGKSGQNCSERKPLIALGNVGKWAHPYSYSVFNYKN